MFKKFFPAVLILITGVSAFCTGKPEDPAVIRVGVFRGPTGFGIIQVMENPPHISDDIRFEFEVLPGPAEMVARVAAGEVDIALFPVNIAAKMYTKGPKYRLAAIVGNGLLYCISRDAALASLADLDGKKVYSVGKGATPDYLLAWLAGKAGISIDADFSYNNPAQLVQLFTAGQVDTVVLPEPFASRILKSKDADAHTVVDFQQDWKKYSGSAKTYPISALVVSPEIAGSHPKAIQVFLDAYSKSIDFVNTNPEAAGILIEKFGVFPGDLAAQAIPGCNLVFIPAAEARLDVDEFLKLLLVSDPVSIGGELPDEAFYATF
ncbi:MAG: ABC transporter substrate-binding protein [Spirochaetales bacterium]|nr:ABC transporter substrate-binding protein [Spirochaetales bacterium]